MHNPLGLIYRTACFSISIYSVAIATVYSAGAVPDMTLAKEFTSKILATAK